MSASSKKKLRKEQNAAALTEKQRAEQKEAKKLKAYSISFIAIMLVVVITAASVMTVTGINRSGILQKNTIAAIVNDREINTVEMTYYLKDAISSTYQQWQSSFGDYTDTYVSWLLNLDVTKPLDKQKREEGGTWADYFMDIALENAKSNQVLCELAEKEGFTLSDEECETMDENIFYMGLYGSMYGYKNLDAYLQSIYGFGASEESYKAYTERVTLAQSYYNHIHDSYTYDEAAIRAYEKGKEQNYSSFSYAAYVLDYNSYLTGGTKGEDGKITYSDDEIAAAKKAAEADAKALSAAKDLKELNSAITGLSINKDKKDVKAAEYSDVLYTQLPTVYNEWLAADSRQENDITYLADTTTTEDENGNEVSELNGYYVVLFQSRNDNNRKLANVRHLLVKFEGGTTDSSGNVSYSDAEKTKAKEEANGYLKTWKEGKATEATFIELVKQYSDDGSKDEGGLFEDISPESEYVPSFLNWSIDANRKAGDTEVIESEYGYHVMYYVGDSDISYRDYLITADLRAEDLEKWYNEVMTPATASFKDLSRMDLSLVISPKY